MTPLLDDGGETGERQLRTLHALAARAPDATSAEHACARAGATLAENGWDVPFALFYLLDDSGKKLGLTASAGFGDTRADCRPSEVDLTSDLATSPWPLREVIAGGQPKVFEGLTERLGSLPCGRWATSPHTAIALPLASPGQARAHGVLLCGVSPHRALEGAYRSFFELTAAQIVTAIRNARAREAEHRRVAAMAALERLVGKAVLEAFILEEPGHFIAFLERQRELRERFVMTLSHDLRTPMAAARMTGQLLRRKASDPEAVKRMADRVVTSMDRADAMLCDLVDASRIEVGDGITIAPEECRLDEIVEAVAKSLGELHGPRFQVHNEAGPLDGRWDGKALQRVLENLAGNALKFGTSGANVTLALRTGAGWVELTVHNEGNPISPEGQEALFNPYRRTDPAGKDAQRGWGIGLLLVRGITEAHNGTARVESDPERGTTFFVRLPMDASAGRPDSDRDG